MRAQPLRWRKDLDHWVLCVPAMAPRAFIDRVIAWAVPLQVSRLRSLPPGDRKDDLEHAIKRLQAGWIQQVVVGEKGDGKGNILLLDAKHPQLEPQAYSIPKMESN